MVGNHQRSIYKWLFGVPGSFLLPGEFPPFFWGGRNRVLWLVKFRNFGHDSKWPSRRGGYQPLVVPQITMIWRIHPQISSIPLNETTPEKNFALGEAHVTKHWLWLHSIVSAWLTGIDTGGLAKKPSERKWAKNVYFILLQCLGRALWGSWKWIVIRQIEQWKENPGCWGYIGDYTAHLYGDYNKPL